MNGQENHALPKLKPQQQKLEEVGKQENEYPTGKDDLIIDDPNIMNLFSQRPTEKNSQLDTTLRTLEANYNNFIQNNGSGKSNTAK